MRLCGWVDAVIHLQTHEACHLAPTCFDPDADRRELGVLGTVQRGFAGLSDAARDHWHWHHSEAAERFKDPAKWPALGCAMSAEDDRVWTYREVATVIIAMWPGP